MTPALIWLFGASAWGSLCNFPAWLILFVERWRVRNKPAHHDVLLLGRFGMLLFSFGVGVGSWQRGASMISHPNAQIGLLLSFFGWLPHPLPEWAPFMWSGAIAAAEALFVWIAALNAKTVGRPAVAWLVYLTGLASWTAADVFFYAVSAR